jgi:hypothetical protein
MEKADGVAAGRVGHGGRQERSSPKKHSNIFTNGRETISDKKNSYLEDSSPTFVAVSDDLKA